MMLIDVRERLGADGVQGILLYLARRADFWLAAYVHRVHGEQECRVQGRDQLQCIDRVLYRDIAPVQGGDGGQEPPEEVGGDQDALIWQRNAEPADLGQRGDQGDGDRVEVDGGLVVNSYGWRSVEWQRGTIYLPRAEAKEAVLTPGQVLPVGILVPRHLFCSHQRCAVQGREILAGGVEPEPAGWYGMCSARTRRPR